MNRRTICRGISRARMNLGQMYEEGRGVQQNINRAIKYYETSSEPYAKQRLEELTKTQKLYQKKFECPICLEKINNVNEKFCSTPCHHTFHAICLFKALKENNRCPICRYIFSEQEESDDEIGPPPDEITGGINELEEPLDSGRGPSIEVIGRRIEVDVYELFSQILLI